MPEYTNPKFTKYLFEKHNMKITKTTSLSGLLNNYKLYYTFGGDEENNVSWNDSKEFETVDAQFGDEDFYEIRDKMDEFYDDFRKKELNKLLKGAGGITAVGLSVITLITGLRLRLNKVVMNSLLNHLIKLPN